MNAQQLTDKLATLKAQRPVTVLGAAVIDVIADAYALPWRGCDIELQQQSVNVGGCALNIAVTLKRLGIDAQNALPIGQGVWAEIIRQRLAKEGLTSVISRTASGPLCPSAVWKISGVMRGSNACMPPPAAWSIFPAISWHPPAANGWSPGWNGSRR